MKIYKKNTLLHWTKEELIDHILCLQHNLKCEEKGNDHLYKTVTAVMHKDPAFAKAVSEVLDVWNSSFGHRYVNEDEKLKAENKKLKRYRIFIPKPAEFFGDGILFCPESIKQLYNGEEVEKIVKERDEYKHRAARAERALQYACKSMLKDRNDTERRVRAYFNAYLERAEKELAEEGKDEDRAI